MSTRTGTIDPAEIARFSKDAATWWDETGPFAPLHRLNPARLGYIKDAICNHYVRDARALDALKNLCVLDVGCGGGLVCEPLARLGARVTGIDGDAVAIDVARNHAVGAGLAITYENTTTDSLLPGAAGAYDVVLALEIVEHVADVPAFVDSCAGLCRPGGVIIFSTLNKTLKSLALGKVAAEYILRWVPAGTHDWRKFIRPSALSAALRRAGATPIDAAGLVFNPLQNNFMISRTDLDVNYLITATRDKKAKAKAK